MQVDWRLKQNNKMNVINFSTKSESIKHYLRKSEVCYFLKQLNEPFWTEAKINVESRADIYLPAKSVAIEILESEDPSNIEEKRKKYGCRIVAINTVQELDIDFIEKAIN
jgi:competence CoiA-like predicted nuclease